MPKTLVYGELSIVSTGFSTTLPLTTVEKAVGIVITEGIVTFTKGAYFLSSVKNNTLPKAENKTEERFAKYWHGRLGTRMLKGVNKKVVEVVDIENEYFEKAILFIKAEKQERDERTIRQRASDYLQTIRYTPRRPLSLPRVVVWLVKFGSAAAVGATFASIILH